MLLGKRELIALLFLAIGLCTVCLALFILSLGVMGGPCSVIVALPGHILYYF